ncbi:MAG: hypothetical protein WDM88_06065 [Galbitalea sp.]
MSTNLAYAVPMRRPIPLRPEEDLDDAPRPRRVQVVTTWAQRRSRPKLVYALGAVVVIFVIFLAQLLITIALSSGAYRITDLQSASVTSGEPRHRSASSSTRSARARTSRRTRPRSAWSAPRRRAFSGSPTEPFSGPPRPRAGPRRHRRPAGRPTAFPTRS